jgi:hypothetical protein
VFVVPGPPAGDYELLYYNNELLSWCDP